MTSAMEQFIAAEVDGIIFALLDPAAADPVINDALAAGIPVVTFAIKHGDNAHVPVRRHPRGRRDGAVAGIEAADALPRQVRRRHRGQDDHRRLPRPSHRSSIASDGFIKGFTEIDPNAVVIARIDGGCVREDAVTAMEDAIQAHPDVNVVYGGNGDNSLGALAALRAPTWARPTRCS